MCPRSCRDAVGMRDVSRDLCISLLAWFHERLQRSQAFQSSKSFEACKRSLEFGLCCAWSGTVRLLEASQSQTLLPCPCVRFVNNQTLVKLNDLELTKEVLELNVGSKRKSRKPACERLLDQLAQIQLQTTVARIGERTQMPTKPA